MDRRLCQIALRIRGKFHQTALSRPGKGHESDRVVYPKFTSGLSMFVVSQYYELIIHMSRFHKRRETPVIFMILRQNTQKEHRQVYLHYDYSVFSGWNIV